MKTVNVKGQQSWIIRSDTVELAVTKIGAMMAPVTFFWDSEKPVQPYYVAPWAEEEITGITNPVLRPLRGDLFCMPFGDNSGDPFGDVAHGQTASDEWTLIETSQNHDGASISLEMGSVRDRWTVTRELLLALGESVIYSRTTISGGTGRLPVGHHATLAPPETGLKISTSPIQIGMTAPRRDLYTSGDEYYVHPPLTEFSTLVAIPTIWKSEPTTDCSIFPSRRGFVDIVGLFPSADLDLAWTAASASDEGYVWFAVRDPKRLPTTLLWMEDHGRHDPPWSGRNCCIGLEGICGYFAEGLSISAGEDALSERGIPTAIDLSDVNATIIPYIQGVARVDSEFGAAASIKTGEDAFVLTGESGQAVSVPARTQFLFDGVL